MKTRINRNYELNLWINGPLLSASSATTGFGFDSQTWRYFGTPAIPASLIKGNLRHELASFCANPQVDLQHSEIDRWFGPVDLDTDDDFTAHTNPAAGAIDFGFAHQLQQSTRVDSEDTDAALPPFSGTRYRVALGPNSKAKTGQLLRLEDYFGAQTRHLFTGPVYASFVDEDDQRRFERWTGKALNSLQALGSLRNAGFGELHNATISGRSQSCDDCEINGNRLQLRLRFDRPLCVGTLRRPDSNTIVSASSISGATLLAVIARRLGELGISKQEFDFNKLHMSFAQPCSRAEQSPGLPKPLSLAIFGQGTKGLRDLCRETEPQIMQSDNHQILWPVFQSDWKTEQHHNSRVFGGDTRLLAEPERLLIVRTAINPNHGSADEGRLFSTEYIDHRHHDWLTTLSLNQPDDRQTRAARLALGQVFSYPLDSIGKSRARAKVTVTRQRSPAFRTSGNNAVTLLLTSPCRMLPNDLAVQGCGDRQTLKAAYEAYFSQLDGRIELLHFYARQYLEGGTHYHHRFLQQSRENPMPYQPELLTASGSVFALRLRIKPRQQRSVWENLLSLGLPPLRHSPERDWHTDPFLRENGYGRFVLNYSDLGSRGTVNAGTLSTHE